MPKWLAAVLVVLLGCSGALAQQQPATPNPRLQPAAEAVAKFIRADPSGAAELFAPQFLQQVSAAQLSALFAKLFTDLGAVTSVKLISTPSSNDGVFDFQFAKGMHAPVVLVLSNAASRNITGLRIGAPTPIHDSFAALLAQMRTLPGQVSFLAQRLEPGKPAATLAEWQAEKALGIGSTFKLYILGALSQAVAQNKLHWDHVVKLDTHSLASGQLQSWPLGTPLTLQSLATLMISISDNTAADQLLRTLGRETIEAQQTTMGNGHAALNRPFLTTLEMFQLKYGDAARRQSFLDGNAAARRALLAALPASATAEMNSKLTAASAGVGPREIENLEWLASAADICHALAWFQAPESDSARATAREILAINRGLPVPASNWSYIGFKGGSEPGVM
ncbi:MAG: serine hydrolase, partial [Terriglobales bacterium]